MVAITGPGIDPERTSAIEFDCSETASLNPMVTTDSPGVTVTPASGARLVTVGRVVSMAGGGGGGDGAGGGGEPEPLEPPPQEASRASSDNTESDEEVLVMAIREWFRGQPSLTAVRAEVVN